LLEISLDFFFILKNFNYKKYFFQLINLLKEKSDQKLNIKGIIFLLLNIQVNSFKKIII